MAKKSLTKALYCAGDESRFSEGDKDSGATKRKQGEPASWRSNYRRDLGRLIHSASFRRLQGKTQLFPSHESDFFRNRLTHSVEVAQIAKTMALRINQEFLESPKTGVEIDTDIVEFAALAHDLGHPPFGHIGEKALDECMVKNGGFEGNAQALRILSRIEKKAKDCDDTSGISEGTDYRRGLDLCARSLASILKYDNEIPDNEDKRTAAEGARQPVLSPRGEDWRVWKGYYQTEKDLVDFIRRNVSADAAPGKFKTIECQIMDLADDIAYSTFDLEDTFKAGFLSPLKMLAADKRVLDRVAEKTNRDIESRASVVPENKLTPEVKGKDILAVLATKVFAGIFPEERKTDYVELLRKALPDKDKVFGLLSASAALFQEQSHSLCTTGYRRTRFTSSLVDCAVKSVQFRADKKSPPLSQVFFPDDDFLRISILKHFVFEGVTQSTRLQIVAARGKEIVTRLFYDLVGDERRRSPSESDNSRWRYLPEDVQDLYLAAPDRELQKRIVCDFIASMTDRYIIEFFSRMHGTSPETIFKDL